MLMVCPFGFSDVTEPCLGTILAPGELIVTTQDCRKFEWRCDRSGGFQQPLFAAARCHHYVSYCSDGPKGLWLRSGDQIQ